MENGTVENTMENGIVIFQILYIKMPYGLVISLLSIYPKETKAGTERDICTPIFVEESQNVETTQMPSTN